MPLFAELPFWPYQAVACGAILATLCLLVGYLLRVRRRRGTTGGALPLVWGLVLVALVAVVAGRGDGFEWFALVVGLTLAAVGVAANRGSRRSRA